MPGRLATLPWRSRMLPPAGSVQGSNTGLPHAELPAAPEVSGSSHHSTDAVSGLCVSPAPAMIARVALCLQVKILNPPDLGLGNSSCLPNTPSNPGQSSGSLGQGGRG